MTQPRSTLISLDATPWYHVVSRCGRRAYLCGFDSHSGRDLSHRRGWIVERLQKLAGVVALDISAYAVMSNHFHLVVRVDAERARNWDRDAANHSRTPTFFAASASKAVSSTRGTPGHPATKLGNDGGDPSPSLR